LSGAGSRPQSNLITLGKPTILKRADHVRAIGLRERREQLELIRFAICDVDCLNPPGELLLCRLDSSQPPGRLAEALIRSPLLMADRLLKSKHRLNGE